MVDISWITEQIAISRAFLDKDIPYLKNKRIDAIIDVRSEYCDNEELIKRYGIKFLHIEIDDGYNPTFEQLEKVFSFTDSLLDGGKKILIHCQNGCGRSPLVAITVLAKRGMNIPEAVSLVEDRHPWVSFSSRQQRFIYMELQKILKIIRNYF